MDKLFSKLDLDRFIEKFTAYFAREKEIFMQGDSSLHYEIISELEKKQYKNPKEVQNLNTSLIHISKQGVLHVKEIYEFVKIIKYMNYLKSLHFDGKLGSWLEKIIFPENLLEICNYFNEKGELDTNLDERFVNIEHALKQIKEDLNTKFRQFFSTKRLESYIVDTQVHYINGHEALLVRGGFNHVLKASIVGRSSGGFFYIVPDSLNELKQKQSALLDEKERIIYEYCQKISNEFNKKLLFLKFINKEFDRFDNYNARVNFAKDNSLEFVLPNKSHNIKLKDFKHPALNEPKPISVDFSKNVLMITGVNAGGKTMLLKSILSATLLAKYLIPMPINCAYSNIGSFKEIISIIEDPQNASNDISTFAGRMREFSKLFGKKNILVGVDEIELGTDADEAASLFFVIIKKLIAQNAKIVITTHHKRLASLLATEDEVELKAALYNEKFSKPTFEFLKGTIGKSYAFETAQRYGIARSIVSQAREVYGEDKEKLNDLIQKNIDLELRMKSRLKEAEQKAKKANELKEKLIDQKEKLQDEFKRRFSKLEREFNEAIDEAKKAAKKEDLKQIHQGLNKAQNAKKLLRPIQVNQKPLPLKVGDRVKYGSTKGVIISIKKQTATIQSDFATLRVPLNTLKRSSFVPIKKGPKIQVQKSNQGSVKLDLHGLRADEALERLDKFLSDALLSGFDEVLVYHGIGTGKLSYAVGEFLKAHPRVVSFNDASPSMGGYGAKVIHL
ncbi:MAG: endonuclease MutS2 [Proteobacteria bacterium]|nr:MAG: endonuclease MutS2 [Pseudomonadota bacterium]